MISLYVVWWSDSQGRENDGSGAETHVYKIYFISAVFEILSSKNVANSARMRVWSGFDGDCLETGEIVMAVEAQNVALDLDLPETIHLHVPQARREHAH